jgi:hypothetical protein
MVADDETAIEQREGEFDVIRVVPIAFLERADHGTGPQAKIPHRLITGPDGFAKLVFQTLVGAKIKQVDIRAGKKLLAAEATHGHQRQPGRERSTALKPPQRLQETVDHQRAATDAEDAVSGALERLPHGRHLSLVVLSQLLVRRECRFHVGCSQA